MLDPVIKIDMSKRLSVSSRELPRCDPNLALSRTDWNI